MAYLVSANDPISKIPDVSQDCMECICKASSGCDETLKCHQAVGGGGYLCGPYVVSWAYWYDGGRPGDKGKPEDFETCVTNRTCAEIAVRGYMLRYGRDCDDNKLIDCQDFARIHKLGFDQCSREIWDTEYWAKFETCIESAPIESSKYERDPEDEDLEYYDEEYSEDL
ncbi:hypothetical protein JTE90_026729 [Oedothorax gibbosus]|uniref:lysozyme n=1 Tax=Oedothorax gibbosus TaxID=931172 RepID=A0AAV6TYP2_9ARAC|nr:hypothetical protein JTE90_026729 [Oedothorax gibbosus]